jgi:hypothetical protein
MLRRLRVEVLESLGARPKKTGTPGGRGLPHGSGGSRLRGMRKMPFSWGGFSLAFLPEFVYASAVENPPRRFPASRRPCVNVMARDECRLQRRSP